MWPILLCSVMAVTIIVERLYHFHRARVDTPSFLLRAKHLLLKGQLEEAEQLCQDMPGPVAFIMRTGIRVRDRSSQDREEVISQAGSRALRSLDRHLRTLGIIAHISPLLGLLGTVTGMIRAFMKIQELGGQVDASVLAGGIWEALITTAAGLSVAIPAVVAYHYFEGRVDDFSAQMKDAIQSLLAWMGVGASQHQRTEGQLKEDVEYGV